MIDFKNIYLASPRGFCAGVDRAIEILSRALQLYGAPIYVKNHIVHNLNVVRSFEDKGAIFIKSIDEIPSGSRAVLSAHGTSPEVKPLLEKRNIQAIDAVCPLVTKVHMEAKKFADQGYFIFYIGHSGHPEPEGVLGNVPADSIALIENVEQAQSIAPSQSEKLIVLTQTTLSFDDTRSIIDTLKSRFEHLITPPTFDICYATQNRQNAVKAILNKIDLLIIVGSKHSSNSNRLRDLGESRGIESHLIDSKEELQPEWLENKKSIGVSSGASAPEYLVDDLVGTLKKYSPPAVIEKVETTKETAYFPLPKELRKE